MSPIIERRPLTVEELAAKLRAIHADVQEQFHDQWNWMDADFCVEAIMTRVEALQRENERLKAPVSDEEKRDYAMTATEIEIFMRIIASRAPQSTENGR
jgi:hypothetical protein